MELPLTHDGNSATSQGVSEISTGVNNLNNGLAGIDPGDVSLTCRYTRWNLGRCKR